MSEHLTYTRITYQQQFTAQFTEMTKLIMFCPLFTLQYARALQPTIRPARSARQPMSSWSLSIYCDVEFSHVTRYPGTVFHILYFTVLSQLGLMLSGLLLQAKVPAQVSAEEARTPLGNITNVLDSQVGTASLHCLSYSAAALQAVNQWWPNRYLVVADSQAWYLHHKLCTLHMLPWT